MSPSSSQPRATDVLRSSLRDRRRELRAVLGWSLVQTLPALLTGQLVARAIDDGFLAGRTGTGLAWLGLLAGSVLVGAWGTRQTYLRLAAVIEPFRDELTRMSVVAGLRRSIAPGAPPDTAGVARLAQQVEIVRDSYASVLLVVQGFIVATTGALIGLTTLTPLLLLVVLPPLAVGLALFGAALPGMARRQRALIIADERAAESATAVARGIRDVVAAGGELQVASRIGVHIEEQADATRELARFTALRTIAVAVGGWLPIILLLAAGPWLIDNGVTTGALVGAIAYVQGIHGALETLVRGLGNTGLWLLVTLRRIVEATHGQDTPVSPDLRPQPGPAGHRLELREVTFSYGQSPEPLISRLDLTLEEGEHLAVVGPSGVGKSTLATLIAGLLAPQSGEVRLGGVTVTGLDPRLAARHRVLIPQEAYVFAGTVLENLAYLNDQATVADIERAVDALGARPLIRRVGGYRAALDAHALSAGERQLITLVRAHLSPAPLAILDEAACHLDAAAEARAELAFALRPGSLIVIAHRISSALRANRILVMDGHRALAGTHEELLSRSALYRDLVGHWRAESATASPAR